MTLLEAPPKRMLDTLTGYPIIGISGKKGHGKSTLAQLLRERHDYEVLEFASPLRDMLVALNPWIPDDHGYATRLADSLEHVYGGNWDSLKRFEPEARRLLQRLGTEAGRDVIGANVWVNHMRMRLSVAAGPVVIPDVRFANEVEAISSWGGMVVRVHRPHWTDPEAGGFDHRSETELDDLEFDIEIANSDWGTLAESAGVLAAVVGAFDGLEVQV